MSAHCSTCSQELPAHAPLGICPSCLIKKTLDPVAQDAPQAGPYRLLEKIGEGSYGSVYIGEQTEPIRRESAVKLLKIDHLDGSAAQRFQAEAQALALLDHPNIARLYEAGVTDEGRPYLALELVPGVSLTEWCDTQDIDIPGRVTIFQKVCAAMQHAHQRGLIHRDLKPENILIDPETGEPKVIDFGIARSTATLLHDSSILTGAHDIIGTPAFLSPEQTDGGSAEIDARTDVYALGAVLYLLLTGKNVIEASGTTDSHFELLKAIRETDPPPASKLNTNIPTNIVAAIRKAMAKKPQDRFPSVEEFSAALAGTKVVCKKNRAPALAGAALILAGLIALAIFSREPAEGEKTPPVSENSIIKGFKTPLTFIKSSHDEPSEDEEKIAPFSRSSRFSWFIFQDIDGRELVFAFDVLYKSPSAGEFIVGAKGAHLPGARHVEPGSAEDQALWDLLNQQMPEAEKERLDAIEWADISGSESIQAKTFADQLFELRSRRAYRREHGTWPAK